VNDLSPVRRPALRWHGGKWLLAPWVISNMPKHRVYVEPYGGAMSVLLRKLPSYAEVYNDLDGDVVNLFRVLRSDRASELVEKINMTPFARDEFVEAYLPTDDAVERARRLIIRSFMGFGSDGCNDARPTGFRSNSNRSGSTPAHDWTNLPANMKLIVERISGVIIENRDAMEVMAKHDGINTLHYIDPPYLWSTRAAPKNSERKNYRHELTDDDHHKLLVFLPQLEGFVMLSGYPSEAYDTVLKGWKRITKKALADGARERTEVLWISPRAAHALSGERLL
jgi:DNA adenine methylase